MSTLSVIIDALKFWTHLLPQSKNSFGVVENSTCLSWLESDSRRASGMSHIRHETAAWSWCGCHR